MDLTELFSFNIVPYLTRREYRSGDTIFEEGSEASTLIFLEHGQTKCYRTHENGAFHLLDFLNAPCFLGDMELMGAQRTTSGVTALADCVCQCIDLSQCRELVLGDVTFLQFLCRNFGRKTAQNSWNMTLERSYPLKNRLATFIIDTQVNGWYRIPHTEASAYLGVSYRHFLYVLSELVRDGLMEKQSGGYVVRNVTGLREYYVQSQF